ncbi:hypothetical protein GWK47_025785 [Chionoecetes opilio]|uniref:G-protein coupled receptors family 1 profile domain-containing protein n=1 Tax=Chionoecetes opilio TaxID=41210 RepID=A0A8J8WAV6_CHIOP|nr:hypothetical protein GWK47_025785 [Chionoecetes opilio]
MNATDDPTPECNSLNSHEPKYWPPSKAFTWAAIVHCYCVIVIGTLCNAVALWCVATCDKTRRPVKVLLLAIFIPAMLTCLIVYSVFAEFRVSLLTCDSNRISRKVMLITWTVFLILEQIERASIAFVAVIRIPITVMINLWAEPLSVWAPHRQKLGLRPTVMAMALASLYFIIIHVVVTVMLMEGKLGHSWNLSYVFSLFNTAMPMVITVVFFLNTTLPVIITAVAYSVIIVIIQRNKRRLAGSQPQEQEATTMDQATRAMLALFISNLLFGLPHSIFRLLGKYPVHIYIAVHIWFANHFVVDSLAFVWFNTCYRRRVISWMKGMTQTLASPLTLLFSQGNSVSPSDPIQLSEHRQETP